MSKFEGGNVDVSQGNRSISHLFHHKSEFEELVYEKLGHVFCEKQRIHMFIDGILCSSSIKNMYMVFEVLDEFMWELPFLNEFNDNFDRMALYKLVHFKLCKGFPAVHPLFLCELYMLQRYAPKVLDMLLRCKYLVSNTQSERVECLTLVPSEKLLSQESDHRFILQTGPQTQKDCRTFTVRIIPGLKNWFDFDIQLVNEDDKDPIVTPDNIHVIFEEFRLKDRGREYRSRSSDFRYMSWQGKPEYNRDLDSPDSRWYKWGDLGPIEGTFVRLIAFVGNAVGPEESQSISHLFHSKEEFKELVFTSLKDVPGKKQQLHMFIDGILSSTSIKNMYMVFEVFEEFHPHLPFLEKSGSESFDVHFDKDVLDKLVHYKVQKRFSAVHPQFLCELIFLKRYGSKVLEMLLRCEDLVSSSESERIDSGHLLPSEKFLTETSHYTFESERELCWGDSEYIFKIKVIPGLMEQFDLQVIDDNLESAAKPDKIHIIFEQLSINEINEKMGDPNPKSLQYMSWQGRPDYNADKLDPRQFKWGNLNLEKGNYIKLIAFVEF